MKIDNAFHDKDFLKIIAPAFSKKASVIDPWCNWQQN